ncbi:hypothetical protein BDR03DRAFT_952038 [Suillus americanus]|nr:hypothetical protein BDR03DRAFT_952038 [Suillus americanus]
MCEVLGGMHPGRTVDKSCVRYRICWRNYVLVVWKLAGLLHALCIAMIMGRYYV